MRLITLTKICVVGFRCVCKFEVLEPYEITQVQNQCFLNVIFTLVLEPYETIQVQKHDYKYKG